MNCKNIRPYVTLLLLLTWLFSLLVFYNKELRPYFSNQTWQGYQTVIPEDLLLEDEWKSIYFDNKKIGFSHFYIKLNPKQGGGYILENSIFMRLPFAGINSKLNSNATIKISKQKKLKKFDISLNTHNYSTRITGERISKNQLRITNHISETKITSQILDIPDNIIVSTLMQPVNRFKNLSLNDHFTFNIFNPLISKTQKVQVEVHNIKKTPEGEIFILECKLDNFKYTLWANKEGQIIKEISPLGLEIVRESQKKATQNLSAIFKGATFRKKYSISKDFNLDKEKLTSLKIKLSNINISDLDLETAHQSIIKKNKNYAIIEIKQQNLSYVKQMTNEKDLDKFLGSDIYIQIDDPKIRNTANHILSDADSGKPEEKIRLFLNWIQDNISQIPTFSIPSASAVLEKRIGDCNEITFLFTAFARTVDIPAKMISGLVFINDRFQYHMWAEVFINKTWISVDPTLEQFPVDATHIALIEGGFYKQTGLANIISNLKLDILEYAIDDD